MLEILPREPPMSQSNVTELSYGNRTFFVVGTAHVSKQSVNEVSRLIQELRPDTVCVELDEGRYLQLSSGNNPLSRNVERNARHIVSERRVFSTIVSLGLASFQQRLGKQLGVTPGAELLAAANTAKEVGARLVLADRDLPITLARCWGNLNFVDKLQVGLTLLLSLIFKPQLTVEQVEALKQRENVGSAMTEFAKHFPRLQIPLIDERDRYLCYELQHCEGQRVVAVVGAGHVPGIANYLQTPIDRAPLLEAPTESAALRLQARGPAVLTLCCSLLAWRSGCTGLIEFVTSWASFVGVSVGIGLLPARPNPVTWVVASLSAPLAFLLGRTGDWAARLELPAALKRAARASEQLGLRLGSAAPNPSPVEAMDSFRCRRTHALTQTLQVYALAHWGAWFGAVCCWTYTLLTQIASLLR